MLKIKPIDDLSKPELKVLKQGFFEQANGPLDGMWHFGFVPMSTHFGFYFEDELEGFCCVNGESHLIQFYLSPKSNIHGPDLFKLISQGNSSVIGEIKGAFVSTAEIQYLNLCLDNGIGYKVNALMYRQELKGVLETELDMQLANKSELARFVSFAAMNIGAPKAWLNDYYGNLIGRNELFGYWLGDELVATGECRLFDEIQTEYADLGMIVGQSHRGKGLATQVLKCLTNMASKKELACICSTEAGNLAAQKAISKAGLSASHRILQFEF
ncbi:acetyltransferase [Marinomonas sp. S3726]|uniref:GNAT family N-acetyltransferase n=1 Tax=Marinomonas sp. S3726 TaxID=579484 RepID=UPI0005FA71E4|nr:GNAT family N-acetyltransferase [Marinomonas sp. S3726]KJZ10942.1 acetyltransferase [Marinomonas sp. S3726]